MSEETQPSLYDWARDRFDAEKDARTALSGAVEATRLALESRMQERFSHIEQLFSSTQEWANRAVDKAEEQQRLHNQSANEWRATLSDFRSNTVTRAEFEREHKQEVRQDFGRYAGWAVAVLIALIEAASRMVR